MVRGFLVLAVALGVASPTPAEAQSESRTRVSKASKKSKRNKRNKRNQTFSRSITVAKRVYDGMPPGFTWPPTRAMKEAGTTCERKLDTLGVQWEHASKEGRIANPIVIKDGMLGGIKYTNRFGAKASSTMECQLGVALASVGPSLRELGIREVKFGSIYNRSYIRGFQGRRELSRHGIAVAMDIGIFVDDAGREVSIESSYRSRDKLLLAAEALFIAAPEFHNIITPKNDPISHYNHFHVEAVVSFRAPDA
ncbi:MAG: extensin family protein [Kofleriaceae bacterium]